MFRIPSLIVGACAASLALVGCGQSEDSAAQPATEAVVQSASSQQAIEQASLAVSDALVEQQNGNVVFLPRRSEQGLALASMWPLMLGQQLQAVSPDGFCFDGTVSDLLVDLDASDAHGNDRYPHASGSILVDASGSGDVDQTLASGSVDYTVVLTVQDDVVVTDPHSGATVTWPSGGSATWTIGFDWSWTDAQNWTYSAAVSKDVDGRSVQVTTAGGASFSAVVSVHHDALRTVSVSGGSWNGSFSLSGIRHVVWTAPSGQTYDVTWDVRSLFEIHLTVNGVHYGPYTLGQIVRRFGCGLNTPAG